jgi:hypothetical protein
MPYPTPLSNLLVPQCIRLSRRSRTWLIGLFAVAGVACSGQAESVSPDQQAYGDACVEGCQAKTAMGCGLSDSAVSTCEQVCEAFLANTSEECTPVEAARIRCENAAGYVCDERSVASVADPEACRAEADAVAASCAIECTGMDADGRCPTVECACPNGPAMISGLTNERGDCRCLTQQTCVDSC